jgi:hypothetical protein
MADYCFARSARKGLEKLSSSIARRIIERIEALLTQSAVNALG